jgi:hypothetical protein
MPLDDGLVSQAGGCGDRGIGGSKVGFPADAIAFPFPTNVPAPTGTGIGVFDIGGMLFACGGNMPGREIGSYGGYDAALGLPGRPLFKGGGMAPLFMKTPCGFAQGACPGLLGILGGITFAWARAAFRLRLNNNAATRPASSTPSRIATPPTTSALLDELEVGVPVLLPPLFPEVVPLDVGVWLLTTVGDAPTVGVAPVVAVAVAVGVTPGVVVGEGMGDGVGDGLGVGEGGTTGA